MSDTFRYEIGSIVRSGGEICGTLGFAVVDPARRRLTHLIVVAPHGRASRLVPIEVAVPKGGEIELSCTPAEFDAMEPTEVAHNESTQPVRESTRAVTWAAFDPAVAFVEGGASVTTTNGSGR